MRPTSIILHKRSSLPGNIPSLTSLSAGEIALNTADAKLFIKTTDDEIKEFWNASLHPYSLNRTLSAVTFQYSGNTATGLLGAVLGGLDNDISGWGSTVVNGSDNDIEGDYAFIGNGSNNKILSGGDFGAILGGQNNILSHAESFILGSNISSHLSGFTYVNNLSSTGKIYGDGSSLTGIVAGDSEATTLVRQQSANWESTYTTFRDASSTFLTSETDSQNLSFNETTKDLSISNGNVVSLSALLDDTGIDTEVRSLSANWQNTFTNFSTNSASYATNTTVNNVSSQLVLNLDFDSYKTDVASATATLLPTTIYQSTSGNWQDVYNTVQTNSASNWDNSSVTTYINNNFLPINGGTLTGNLSVLGDLVYVDTSVAVVSTMYIDTNTVLDPALRITQRGTGDVIRIEDAANPDSTPFIINSDGLVGIGTASPNEELTVVGNVSATGSYYGDGSNLTGIVAGDTVATTLVRSNSGFWQSTYSTVSSLSSNWQTAYAYVSANSVNLTATNIIVTNDLTVTDTVSAKFYQGTILDWMTLVRGYKTTPTLNVSLPAGDVYNYIFSTSGSDVTYYRYIANDGSEDSFYGNFTNPTLSNLITTKKIIL